MKNNNLTEADIRAFLFGQATEEIKRRIAVDLRSTESVVRRLMDGMKASADNALNIDWRRLLQDTASDDPTSLRGGAGTDTPEYADELTNKQDRQSSEASDSPQYSSALSGDLGSFGTKSTVRRWTFRQKSEGFGWPGEQDARLTAVWDGAVAQLAIRVSGLLVLGPGCRIEILWLGSDGSERGRTAASDKSQVMHIQPAANRPPASTDRFRLCYIQQLRGKQERNLTWEETFGAPTT